MRNRSLLIVAAMSFVCWGTAQAQDNNSQGGGIGHLVLNCAAYDGAPGSTCTIETSNVPEIPAGTKIYHFQAANIVPGLLDTNIVYDAGGGNRAVGHCLFDIGAGTGLCDLTDGTGELAGFEARFELANSTSPFVNESGPYRFRNIQQLPENSD